MQRRRSEVRHGVRILEVLFGGWALAVLAGCEYSPEIEDIVEKRFVYSEQNLTPAALAERTRKIDEDYAEPRTPTKVQLSYELSLDSISRVNSYEALWRGTRACAWLTFNDPDRSRREDYAGKGILIGQEAVKKSSTKVESYYYLAHCLAGLAKVRGQASVGLVHAMRDRIRMALAIDEKYDFGGPQRFLGQLMVETADYPVWNIGTFDQGLTHLKRAVDLCPDFGENHLVYAKALHTKAVEDESAELLVAARTELEKVMACPKPKDYTAEHEGWLQEASKLLAEWQTAAD